MKPRQHLSHFNAVCRSRRQFRRAVQLCDDGRGLAVQLAEKRAVATRHGIGNRHGVMCQMAHQIEIKRQLRGREVLEDRQDIRAARGRQKEVAVLDARRNTTEIDDFAEFVMLQPVGELGIGDSSEYGHAGERR